MQQHGSKYFVRRHTPLPPPPPDPWGGVKRSKFNFFQNKVILQFKLNVIMNVGTWWQIFCPQTPLHPSSPDHGGWGRKVKIQLFLNMVKLHIKLNGIMNAATWQQIYLPAPPPPPPNPVGGVKRSKFNFFRTWSYCISHSMDS